MSLDFELGGDQQLLAESLADFCARELRPHGKRWDEEERFPSEIVPKLAEMGLWGMRVPEAYGGAGMSMLDVTIVLEELGRVDGSVALTIASHNALCSGHILLAGNDEQKKKYLPRLARGEVLGAWALTEPGSGSDAGAAKTRAVKTADGWVLNGTKTFITQGSVGGIYVVLASTSPDKRQRGLTAFVIEAGTPGLRPGKHIEKMGCRASDTTEVVLENCEVPDSQRLGAVDRGFYDTLQILDKGRIGIASMAVGLARGALEQALRYSTERQQFGTPIAHFQAIKMMLASMATDIEASQLLCRHAAWLDDQQIKHTKESSICKLFAAQAATRVCNQAIQIHGGYGFTREFPVERYLRDTKLCEIGEGTNEVQRMILARELCGV